MTAQILAAELGTLIQDSKRKNTELRTAAEKSLQDLKALPQTSETQLSAGKHNDYISRRPYFISPFLIACGTHNAKFATTGVSCLQRLSVSRALPKERLNEVLDAFRDSVSASHEIQLKILQSLPSLLGNYPVEVRGDNLSTVLQICSGLQNAKNAAVSNTAAATLQQLVITVFDRVALEDEHAIEIPIVTEVNGDDGLVPVRPAANDAYKTFNDLVLLIIGEKPRYMRLAAIPPPSVLELIEAILSNHSEVMTHHVEQIHLLRTLLMPLIIQSLSDRLSFPVTVRIVRILNLIIRYHLEILPSECEIALGLLNHMLDPEASQLWKRALCLEVFRGIYADPRLLLTIYTLFDATEGKKAIFGDNLAAFVRLAVEKPSLIGLGQQSTIASSYEERKNTSESAVAEAGAMAGLIGSTTGDLGNTSRPFGISSQWSSIRTPCIEHLDKSEPPNLPDTYVHGLVLTCITNVSESMAKFVLPLTVHHESRGRRKKIDDISEADTEVASPAGHTLSRTQSFRKKTVPVNPLELTDHPAYPCIETSSTLVTECWPAVLATCSTFLNATLDTDYYRALVRAIQKFTQVAGLLRLSTPRDAFLTTLGKAAVPSNLLLSSVTTPKTASAEGNGLYSNAKGLLSVDSLMSQTSAASGDGNRRPSHDVSVPALGPRNLLCLRALLNLAIALGPTLGSAWSIVFETLQVADLVMALSNRGGGARSANVRIDPESTTEKMDSEISAVQAAARRLFESTVDYPNESFSELLKALCALINTSLRTEDSAQTLSTSSTPKILHQRRVGSVSGISLNTDSNSRDSAFALNKIDELASLNIARLSQYDSVESGWDILISELIKFSTNKRNSPPTRLLAADILSRTVKEIAEISMSENKDEDIQARILAALRAQIGALHHTRAADEDVHFDTNVRVHQITLDALKSVVEQCGEALVEGWAAVLQCLLSVFSQDEATTSIRDHDQQTLPNPAQEFPRSHKVMSRSLARSAFATINLVCSDFLAVVPLSCLSVLLDLLSRFGCQREDLNMSLTAITYFWNVADFLQTRSDLSALSTLLLGISQQVGAKETLAGLTEERPVHASWFELLMHLSDITVDERAEVRNSAVHTIQRIFESYDEQLNSETWMICLRLILFGMLESNLAIQQKMRVADDALEKLAMWDDTTKAVLQTISALMNTYSGKLNPSQTGEVWSQLLEYLQQYFACNSYTLGTSVFDTVTEVLSHHDDVESLGLLPLLQTADMWTAYLRNKTFQAAEDDGNQSAFVAYANAFSAIYRLAGPALDAKLPSMLLNLESCIVNSDVVAYTSDVDTMTKLQRRVLDCLSSLDLHNSSLLPPLINVLGRLCILPYKSASDSSEKRGPTFVAMAKKSMDLLQQTIVTHNKEKEVYEYGIFVFALQSLAQAIEVKYIWQREGKSPTLWERATTTAIAVIESGLPHFDSQVSNDAHLKELWTVINNVAFYITRAQIDGNTDLPPSLGSDQKSDMTSYKKLRDLISLPLGSAKIPDTIRRVYTRNLFSVSLVHTPLPGELPDVANAPLEDLYKIRYGQTARLECSPRGNMSYTCLQELASIVAVHDSDPSEIKLAQAAAPYFILRAAIPIKTYIADHPLRGCMPQPETEREELLIVLEQLRELKSEPQAIPNVPGVSSKYRKHLHRLYPLLVKAMRVARHDPEVSYAILKLLDLVGNEFGMEEEDHD